MGKIEDTQKFKYMEINPFIIAGKIEPRYFCDRVAETKEILNLINNQNNIVLVSPRRMGKTGLIRHCFNKKEIRDKYITFFIDILQTSSLREFTYLLGKEIYDTLLPLSKRLAEKFIRVLKSINGKFTYDPFTGLPSFNLSIGEIQNPEFTLKEIFEFLEAADKRCLVSIDEFQRITDYPEKNVEAVLRTYIQNCSNSNFIFAGSRRHILQNMFLDSARPFYHSASLMELMAIPEEVYSGFVIKNFKEKKKAVVKEDVRRIYEDFEGHTYYMQRIFNQAYSLTPEEGFCGQDTIKEALRYIIDSNAFQYRETLANISEHHKELLFAIAKEGRVDQPTSGNFIIKHNLRSASSVQGSLRKLIDLDLVTKQENTYFLTDKFLSLWINLIYGIPPEILR